MALSTLVKPALNAIAGRPLIAVVEITLRCNSACRYCNLELNKGHYEMTREEIQRVFSHLYEEGLRFLLIQGGEPMLRRDLVDILTDLKAIGYSLTLVTNGTCFTPAKVEALQNLGVQISISLDSLERDRYAHIRGRDQLPAVLKGIELLRNYPHPKYLTCVVSQQNLGEVEDVVAFAGDRGFVPVVGAYHWDISRYGKVDEDLQYKTPDILALFERLLHSPHIPDGYYRHYIKENIQWLQGRGLPPCDAGRYGIAIDCAGRVAPCLALPKTDSLLEKPLPTLLAQLDHDEIQRCSAASTCNLLCSRVVGTHLRHPLLALKTYQAMQG
ncbi:MAG: radical SAM protein [Elainellaceae cyanobacterium]